MHVVDVSTYFRKENYFQKLTGKVINMALVNRAKALATNEVELIAA